MDSQFLATLSVKLYLYRHTPYWTRAIGSRTIDTIEASLVYPAYYLMTGRNRVKFGIGSLTLGPPTFIKCPTSSLRGASSLLLYHRPRQVFVRMFHLINRRHWQALLV